MRASLENSSNLHLYGTEIMHTLIHILLKCGIRLFTHTLLGLYQILPGLRRDPEWEF